MPKSKQSVRRGVPRKGPRTSNSTNHLLDGISYRQSTTVSLVESTGLWDRIPRGPAQSEMKYIDTGISTPILTGNFAFGLLNGTVPGVGLSGRLGRQFRVHRIDYNLRIYPDVENPPAGANVAIIFARDRQADGANFATNDMLMSQSSQALLNPTNMDRFTILRRFDTHMFGYSTTATQATTPTNAVLLLGSIPCNFVTTCNSGVAGTIVDIQTNSLFWLGISDVSNIVNCSGNIRVWFSDN